MTNTTRASRRAVLSAVFAFTVMALQGCWPFGESSTSTVTTASTEATTTVITTTVITTTVNYDCKNVNKYGKYCDHCGPDSCLACSEAPIGEQLFVNPESGKCMSKCPNGVGFMTPGLKLPQLSDKMHPLHHKGVEWPTICVDQEVPPYRFLGIGDWGGVIHWPKDVNKRKPPSGTAALEYGVVWNHTWKFREWNDEGNHSKGRNGRRFVQNPDTHAQTLVARSMKKIKETKGPVDFVLNAGDNFYTAGLDDYCGPDAQQKALEDSTKQFHYLWEQVYGDIAKVPWLSVLGNHDFGGKYMSHAWDGQIFRTWADKEANWRMPAPFWMQRVSYRDFTVMIYMLDSNTLDAKPPRVDPSHNICQKKPGQSECWGMSEATCSDFFKKLWSESVLMMETDMEKNPHEWHIVVTHFPGYTIADDKQIVNVHQKYGVDFMFTGHTHLQSYRVAKSGIPYVISGGGGGITSDAQPHANGKDDAYGFVEFLINKEQLHIDMFSWGGDDPGELISMSEHTVKRAPRNADVETMMKVAAERRVQLAQELAGKDVDEYTKSVMEAVRLKWSHADMDVETAFVPMVV